MTKLGALCLPGGIQTGPFGSQLHADEYSVDGTPVVMPQDIGDNTIETGAIARVPAGVAQRLERHRLLAGDIVYSRRGDVERRSWVSAEQEGWLCGTGCLRVRLNPKLADSRFISYYLGTPDSRAWIVAHAVGATMLNLNTSILSAVPVNAPPLPTQRAIAEVLGALDDKIAANLRVAQAADALVRGRYEQLGSEPRVTVRDLFANPRIAARPPIDADAYVGLEHVPRRSMWLDQFGDVDGLLSGKFVFERDDVLFGKLRPYFHKVVVSDRRGVCSTDILVLRPLRPELKGYSWAAVSSDAVVERVSAMSAGTRMPRTNWSDLAACEVPWPGDSAAAEFSSFVVRARDRVAAATVESRHLATLRDTLLPHLMSGRITVRDAEEQVGEAL